MKLLKKIFLSFFIIISLLFSVWQAEAIKVTVTEKIPWVCGEKQPNWNYICDVKVWFEWVLLLMWTLIKYFTFLAALGWVLFIVVNGIQYSMWWVDQKFKSQSKENIVKTLIWLILLLLSWFILNIIAPWVYK